MSCCAPRRGAPWTPSTAFAPPCRSESSIELADELYLADAATLLARLQALDGTVRCAMVVGHNPGIEDLAARLVGSGDAALRAQLAAKFPTGALVALSFDCAWGDLGTGDARINALFMPRPPRA